MNNTEKSSSFFSLHPAIQKWVWQQGWPTLRDIQEEAIKPILDKDTDLIISASTAGGKTEAAFLPIFSDIIKGQEQSGIHTIGIIPLKALINDQYRRLSFLGEHTGVKVTPWHGDVSQSIKSKLLKESEGVLLITPESLESLLINKSGQVASLLNNLSFIVIDELHAFIGTERGKQLQSLMTRLDILNKVKSIRIGLSATLGDMDMAYEFMRPNSSNKHLIISSDGYRHDLKLQVRGYVDNPPSVLGIKTFSRDETTKDSTPFEEISEYLFEHLRGTTNLVFANSRMFVEEYSCYLREKSENYNLPNEFYPHHGSLSKELREELETRMHNGNLPTTTICTNTLELGIDIGSVDSVVQIGIPSSVSSLRQRLGRSGRQVDAASVLRMFCIEELITDDTSFIDKLRLRLFIAIAVIELLLEGWYEPPEINKLHFSTLVHQIIAIIAQYGGLSPQSIWILLCKSGAFNNIRPELFKMLLSHLGIQNIIQQDHDGSIVLGSLGEKLVNNYHFYAVFSTPIEYIFQYNGKIIASLPIINRPEIGNRIILAGRKWTIKQVDDTRKAIIIIPSKGGEANISGDYTLNIHSKVAQKISELYKLKREIRYLNKNAQRLYQEGLKSFELANLHNENIYLIGNQVYLFPWLGTKVCYTMRNELLYIYGVNVVKAKPEICIICEATLEQLFQVISKIIQSHPTDSLKLARKIGRVEIEKFDLYLSDELLFHDFAVRRLDTQKSHQCWKKLHEQIKCRIN